MKKYKLIKQYKGSPELGIIVTVNNDGTIQVPIGSIGTLIHGKPSDYPEYWEEIIEKDYEILSCKHFMTGGIYAIGQTFLSNEGYRRFNELDINRINRQDGMKVYSIYSVKRLSDGEIFSVGDKVYSKFTKNINSWKNCFVHAFIIKNNKIKFQIIENETKGIYTLEEIQHYKKPLFTTEDGVDVYEGDLCWAGHIEKGIDNFYLLDWAGNSLDMKYFSTKEAAEKYILENQKILTTKDGVDIYHGQIYYTIKFNNTVISNKAYKGGNYSPMTKRFSTFEKAEEYILYNKKSLSLNDLIDNMHRHMSASTLIKKCEKLIRNNK